MPAKSSTTSQVSKILNNKKQLYLFISFGLVTSAFMPWLNLSGLTGVSGIQGDGLYSLVLSVVMLIIIVLSPSIIINTRLLNALAFAVLFIGLYTIITINSSSFSTNDMIFDGVSVGIGEGLIINIIFSCASIFIGYTS